ncbi:MAG: Na/Pi cotransporter family protein, partial [Candidatus Omnitrophica bacterium]|nr:Na/Pi cotransporter family protein [Candidatus Omnitrophota bacterium]
ELALTGETKFLDDHLLDTPEIAVESVVKELHHMTLITRQGFEKACLSFINNDPKLTKEVSKIERAVDSLQEETTRYLVRIFSRSLSPELSNRLPSLLHSVNDIEKISDHAESIAEATERRQESPYAITSEAVDEMQTIYLCTQAMFEGTLQLLDTGDEALGQTITECENRIDELKRTDLAHHVDRLRAKQCHPLAGLGFVAFLNNVEKIGDHLNNIKQAALHHFAYDQKRKSDRSFAEPCAGEAVAVN